VPDIEEAQIAYDAQGERVLAAHATAGPLNWLVLVELPENEANAPLNTAILRTVAVLVAGFLLALLAALLLARLMVVPVRALTVGAARIGAGALDHRITVKSGDELEALGEQMNEMAAKLQTSYATLERKVEERTEQLQEANLSKSRFLAAASHDLRQPLHALNLFAAQLRSEKDQAERDRLAVRIDTAVGNMNELFNALLDISRLEAGVLKPELDDFPVERVFKRIENTFAASARGKQLRFAVVAGSAWIRSDFILLERILLNLVSNAVRYTTEGGVVVGCRRRGDRLRIDVIDSGPGIPEDQRQNVFGEFYRLAAEEQSRHRGGLGLGLSIVERLGELLGHPIELASAVGRGSRFSVVVPLTRRHEVPADVTPAAAVVTSPTRGKLVLVIDDDPLVLEGMRGILETWGCDVTLARSGMEALARLAGIDRTPDVVISDYRLADGKSGMEAIEAVRRAVGSAVPAFLISGDTAPERLRDAAASNYLLLHKPVSPMALRAVLNRLFKAHETVLAGTDAG
jgi:signal transduction histidine kinase/CheY-like chemotaxis protein